MPFKVSVAAFGLLLTATQVDALSLSETRHLLDRTGFGSSPQETSRFLALTREEAVDHLLGSLGQPAVLPPPPFVLQPRPNYWAGDWEGREITLYRVHEIDQLQVWWVQEMITTPNPMAERLALFWHNHLVSRFDPGQVSAPFYDQIALFRRYGSQSFRTLLRGILRDPMMLTSLDNVHNTKARPNENLARELLELFTLGIGNYSEADIKEVSRVLAGHGVDFENWTYQRNLTNTDTGEKHILGRVIPPGDDDGVDALVEIILSRPETARLIAAKFYTEFVSLVPNPREIERLADVLRRHDYEIEPFLKQLLLSDDFWDEDNRASLIKSPIDLIVGFSRTFGFTLPDQKILVDYMTVLGQRPFMAPSVAGWRGGTDWLTTKSIVDRERILKRLWDAYRGSASMPESNPGDLLVRFGSEHRNTPAHFVVEVNGVQVGAITATLGADTYKKKSSNEPGNLKPMWETAIIPKASLPATVEKVTVRLSAKDPDTHLFVNWISMDGDRYSPNDARWVGFKETDCPDTVPLGTYYCDVGLEFDIKPVDPFQATLDDLRAPHNSNVEYGTSRLSFTPDGAATMPKASNFGESVARHLLTSKPSDEMQARENDRLLEAYLLAAPPSSGTALPEIRLIPLFARPCR
ncbi:DUF1800 domain-containing protein [Agrobacterium rubi]|nr:DUF1800 domain-containing protein [Agrobacterium rubi]OCJ53453.1 hypothetical protein A6U92_24295 [Agrobacterium rubi]